MQKRGVQVLLDTIRNRLKSRPQMDLDAAVQTEVIKCLKSVMNNIEGMNAIMHHRGALELLLAFLTRLAIPRATALDLPLARAGALPA